MSDPQPQATRTPLDVASAAHAAALVGRLPHGCRCYVAVIDGVAAQPVTEPAAGPSFLVCPNTPPCRHPGLLHDIEDLEDPRPMCCVDDCRCGHPAPARVTT